MNNTYAKIVADSIANDIRITTMECYYPLMIHAQLMTHRMFSRNAQSSRATPVAKMLEQVEYNPAMPSHWGKNQAGMQAYEELKSDEANWKIYAKNSASFAKSMASRGYHKQIVNRLTMPFQYINVIVTATEWDNFFNLRLHDADPTMMELARKMKEAMDDSNPLELDLGDWHLPYLWEVDDSDYGYRIFDLPMEDRRKVSAARCARVSYDNHNGTDTDIKKDLDLADRLLRDGHMSPFEHQATPMEYANYYDMSPNSNWYDAEGVSHQNVNGDLWSGNFRGWIQYRQRLE